MSRGETKRHLAAFLPFTRTLCPGLMPGGLPSFRGTRGPVFLSTAPRTELSLGVLRLNRLSTGICLSLIAGFRVQNRLRTADAISERLESVSWPRLRRNTPSFNVVMRSGLTQLWNRSRPRFMSVWVMDMYRSRACGLLVISQRTQSCIPTSATTTAGRILT